MKSEAPTNRRCGLSNYLLATEKSVVRTAALGAVSMGFSRMGEKGAYLLVLRSVISVLWGPVFWVALFCFRGHQIAGTPNSCPIWMTTWQALFRPPKINLYSSPEWEGRRSNDKISVKISLLTWRRQVDYDKIWLDVIIAMLCMNPVVTSFVEFALKIKLSVTGYVTMNIYLSYTHL